MHGISSPEPGGGGAGSVAHRGEKSPSGGTQLVSGTVRMETHVPGLELPEFCLHFGYYLLPRPPGSVSSVLRALILKFLAGTHPGDTLSPHCSAAVSWGAPAASSPAAFSAHLLGSGSQDAFCGPESPWHSKSVGQGQVQAHHGGTGLGQLGWINSTPGTPGPTGGEPGLSECMRASACMLGRITTPATALGSGSSGVPGVNACALEYTCCAGRADLLRNGRAAFGMLLKYPVSHFPVPHTVEKPDHNLQRALRFKEVSVGLRNSLEPDATRSGRQELAAAASVFAPGE